MLNEIICEKFGGIDILISNAGTAPGGAIGEVGYVGAQSASDTTSYGFSNLTHASGPLSGSVSGSNPWPKLKT